MTWKSKDSEFKFHLFHTFCILSVWWLETQVSSIGREDPLEKAVATHSSILAWEIPRTEEPGGLLSKGSQRVRDDWVTITSLHFRLHPEHSFSYLFNGDKTCLPVSLQCLSSVQFSCSVVSDSLQPHELQHTRPPCPSPTPGVYPNSCPSSRWHHPAISSSVVPFSSCPQSLPASGSFPMSQLFAWGGQSTEVSASASVLPVNTQGWSPLG